MTGVARMRWVVVAVAVMLLASCSSSDVNGASDETEEGSLSVPVADAPRILSPEIGDEVPRTFTVEFDYGPVDPTGETVSGDAGGQFHILVDEGCLDNGDSFPEESATHFKVPVGETTTSLQLEPGAHELCLQFGNVFDVAFYATDTITIRVV